MRMRDAGAGGERMPRLVVSDFEFGADDRARLSAALGADGLLLVRGVDEMREALRAHPEADVLCTYRPPADSFELGTSIRWLALPSAGADGAVRAGLVRPGGPVVTDARGVHAGPISEFVLSMLLLWARSWPVMLAEQRQRTWPAREARRLLSGRELRGTTLGIVGLGAIGREVARLGRAFGMRVMATRRTAAEGEIDADVDTLLPAGRLRELLGASEYVVIATPSTPETYHLIGADELRAMTPSAFLVNIARGDVVDEAALIAALQAGRPAGAGLDVFEDEPLPASSPLWTMPNVIISPHVSGSSDRIAARFTDLFLENIARYRAGRPLLNVVDPAVGY